MLEMLRKPINNEFWKEPRTVPEDYAEANGCEKKALKATFQLAHTHTHTYIYIYMYIIYPGIHTTGNLVLGHKSGPEHSMFCPPARYDMPGGQCRGRVFEAGSYIYFAFKSVCLHTRVDLSLSSDK